MDWNQIIITAITAVIPAIISGCIAAGIFSWIGISMDGMILQKLFGFLLIFTGLREIMYKSHK